MNYQQYLAYYDCKLAIDHFNSMYTQANQTYDVTDLAGTKHLAITRSELQSIVDTHGGVKINAEYGVCLIPTISLLPFLGISKELFLTRISYLNQSKTISDNNYKLTEDQFHYLLTGEHLV